MQLIHEAFIDVDTQFDFMDPRGSLYIAGAEKIVPNLKRLFACASKHGFQILSTMDTHRVDDPEFKDFPPHCVKGTPGQRKIAETTLPGAIIVPFTPNSLPAKIPKDAQLIFEKPTLYIFDNPNFMEYIRGKLGDFVVFGVATDYCVKIIAEGLAERGYAVTVVSDAICAVNRKAGEEAIERMKQAGIMYKGKIIPLVTFKTTDEITSES